MCENHCRLIYFALQLLLASTFLEASNETSTVPYLGPTQTTTIQWIPLPNLTLIDELNELDEHASVDEEYMQDNGTDVPVNFCPETRNGITNEARLAVTDFHNRMRTRLAKGLQRDKRSLFAPQASNLLKMMYDCDNEATAQAWADQCLHHHTPQPQRRHYDIGENLAWIPGNRTDEEFLTFSSYLWWQEVETIGIGNSTVFSFEYLKQGLGHYTQMAWHGSFRLGCGMRQCNDWMYVVCHYSPRGNGPEGRNIYKIGKPCSNDAECPPLARCLQGEGLCEIPPEIVRRRRRSDIRV